MNILSQLLNHLQMRARDEEGATAVEYGIMVALIAAAIILTVTALGTQLDGTFQSVLNVLPGAPAETSTT